MSAEKMDVAEVLEKALAAFGPNGEKWVNHTPHDDEDTHCMLSALPGDITPMQFARCESFLAMATGQPTEPPRLRNYKIYTWNDAHTWPEVKAAYLKAIASAREVRP